MFIGALVSLGADATLSEMIDAWTMIVGRENQELAGLVGLVVIR